jgi:hypothetical protein
MASCKVYNRLVEFVGHVEHEGGYYNIYRGWADFVGHIESEGGYYYTVYRAGVQSVGRVKSEGGIYKVYRDWTHWVGHLRREGRQYKVYQGMTDLIGLVELEDTVQVIPVLLSGGAALLLLL